MAKISSFEDRLEQARELEESIKDMLFVLGKQYENIKHVPDILFCFGPGIDSVFQIEVKGGPYVELLAALDYQKLWMAPEAKLAIVYRYNGNLLANSIEEILFIGANEKGSIREVHEIKPQAPRENSTTGNPWFFLDGGMPCRKWFLKQFEFYKYIIKPLGPGE